MSVRVQLEKLLRDKMAEVESIKSVLTMLPNGRARQGHVVGRLRSSSSNVQEDSLVTRVFLTVQANPKGITSRGIAEVLGVGAGKVYSPLYMLRKRGRVVARGGLYLPKG